MRDSLHSFKRSLGKNTGRARASVLSLDCKDDTAKKVGMTKKTNTAKENNTAQG